MLVAALIMVALSGCTAERSDGVDPAVAKYFESTRSHSIESWRSIHSIEVYLVAFMGNAVPGLHLFGVWFDTVVVLWKSKSLSVGIGAIMARERNCPHLVHSEDYKFVQALWLGSVASPNLRSALSHAQEAQRLSRIDSPAARSLAVRHMLKAAEEKIGLKVAGKVVGKSAIKIIIKKLSGFVPVLGGVIAVVINKFWFLDPIQESSVTFYEIKASLVCSSP